MKINKLIKSLLIFISLGSVFIIPFYFILVNASKHQSEINLSNLYFPSEIYFETRIPFAIILPITRVYTMLYKL